MFKLSKVYGMHEKGMKLTETFSARGDIEGRVRNKIYLLRGKGLRNNED
jgi:hypothetical protein